MFLLIQENIYLELLQLKINMSPCCTILTTHCKPISTVACKFYLNNLLEDYKTRVFIIITTPQFNGD